MKYRIAQVNIGRIKAHLDDSVMAGFVARLDAASQRNISSASLLHF